MRAQRSEARGNGVQDTATFLSAFVGFEDDPAMFAKRASEEGCSLGTLLGGTGGKDVLRRLHDDLFRLLEQHRLRVVAHAFGGIESQLDRIAREVSPSSAFAAERMSRAAGRCAVGSRLTASAAAASALFRNGMNVLSLCSSASG